MKYIKIKLKNLLNNRIETQEELLEVNEGLKTVQQMYIQREFSIKNTFATEINNFSNSEQRKLELEKRLIKDATLKQFRKRINELEEAINILKTKDKIEKLKERYLFKYIDIKWRNNEL